ncbi:hypothetical protein CHARACLAT_001142 [Characodon lateralis]|uniref:Seven cysteines N-terminal domain-containing protein n=1 Tax=Characodon lateralis TaxID=208331 RepID=A0ABU7E617_9TELE|nr:hypothetical protein [Characodon lateralis]
MTLPTDLRPLPGLLVSAVALVMVLMTLPASALGPETCFSRQHQGTAVIVRQALNRQAAAMINQTVNSERECVIACCSKEVLTGDQHIPGARCNMAVFKGNKHSAEHNCLLFHCPTELDCPLMKAPEGSNTYDIYKGLSHPPTLRPVTMTTTIQTTTTTSRPTTPTTTQTTTTAQALPSPTEPPPPFIIIATVPVGIPPTTTTTKTPTTTTMGPSATFTSRKPNKTSKKQNKTIKKGKSHPSITTTTTQTAPSSTTSLPAETARKEVEHKNTSIPETTTAAPTFKTTSTTTTASATTTTIPMSSTTLPTTTITTTTSPTTTTTITTTTTTTTQCTTSTSTTEPTTTVMAQPPSLIFIPKDPIQSDPDIQPGHTHLNSSSSQGKVVVAAQGALKGGVVTFMVLGLAVLTLALAVGGRKAMESFDRRHYTRLELNDLHYEI